MGLVTTLGRAIAHEVRLIRGAIYRRLYMAPDAQRHVVDEFHRLYFDARAFNMTWRNTYWLGHAVLKCPLDLWLYQEMIHEIRPDVIVETGTAYGGSALFLASMCDLVGHGRVVTIDLDPKPGLPVHPRIRYRAGSSTARETIDYVAGEVAGADRVMVLLDSDHSKAHVLAELDAYAPFVTRGSYLVVEDTNLNGHPVEAGFGEGPYEAVQAFLARSADFSADPTKDKLLLTFNPGGFLKRKA